MRKIGAIPKVLSMDMGHVPAGPTVSLGCSVSQGNGDRGRAISISIQISEAISLNPPHVPFSASSSDNC